jgi:hypothetical protein
MSYFSETLQSVLSTVEAGYFVAKMPFTWKLFSQTFLCSTLLGYDNKVAGVLMNSKGMCFGLSTFYALHDEETDFVDDLKAKTNDGQDTEYFKDLLFTQLSNNIKNYVKNSIDLHELTDSDVLIQSLLKDRKLDKLPAIGFLMYNEESGHAIAFKQYANEDGTAKYDLFDPNFGEIKGLTDDLLKYNLASLINFYGYKEFFFEDIVSDYKQRDAVHYYKAFNIDDVNMLKYLIEQGQIDKIVDKNDDDMLHRAINKNNKEIVKLLIENGADIEALNKEGATPLVHAIQNDKTSIALLLIKEGADINKKIDKFGLTAAEIFEKDFQSTLDSFIEESNNDESIYNSFLSFVENNISPDLEASIEDFVFSYCNFCEHNRSMLSDTIDIVFY